jgi:hypothetical protein
VTDIPPSVVPILTPNSTPASSFIVIASQTLLPGGSPINVSGTIYRLPTSGSSVLVNGKPSPITALPTPTSAPYVVIASSTLLPGSAITISGTTYSLPSTGSSILVNGTPSPIASLLQYPTEYIVGTTQTLIPGAPAITVSGSVISLESQGGSVVVGGTSTEAVSAVLGGTTSTVKGMGGVIQSLGGFGSSNGTVFSGGAAEKRKSIWVFGGCLGLGVLVLGAL